MSTSQLQNIAAKFDTIELSEMDKVQLMNRVDTKFTFTKDKLIEILPALIKDYRILTVDGVLTSDYESLYYDDANLKFYKEHHRKRLDRFKIRFRKYVNSDIAFLEIKHKNKGRTEKSRIPAEGLDNELNEKQKKFIRSTGVESSGVKTDELVPSLLNKFSRITLVNKDFSERLTFDIDLTFKWGDNEEVVENVIIAELKQSKVNRNSPFYQIMKKNMIRPLRVSKYCIGVINIYGLKNVRYNRFKKKLLKLNKLQTNAA